MASSHTVEYHEPGVLMFPLNKVSNLDLNPLLLAWRYCRHMEMSCTPVRPETSIELTHRLMLAAAKDASGGKDVDIPWVFGFDDDGDWMEYKTARADIRIFVKATLFLVELYDPSYKDGEQPFLKLRFEYKPGGMDPNERHRLELRVRLVDEEARAFVAKTPKVLFIFARDIIPLLGDDLVLGATVFDHRHVLGTAIFENLRDLKDVQRRALWTAATQGTFEAICARLEVWRPFFQPEMVRHYRE